MSEQFTVFYDDGRKPHFDKFDSRDEAERHLNHLVYEQGQYAIILEDESE